MRCDPLVVGGLYRLEGNNRSLRLFKDVARTDTLPLWIKEGNVFLVTAYIGQSHSDLWDFPCDTYQVIYGDTVGYVGIALDCLQYIKRLA